MFLLSTMLNSSNNTLIHIEIELIWRNDSMPDYDIKIQQSLGTTKMNTRFTTHKCDFYANSIYHKIYVMKYMLLFFISI